MMKPTKYAEAVLDHYYYASATGFGDQIPTWKPIRSTRDITVRVIVTLLKCVRAQQLIMMHTLHHVSRTQRAFWLER